jgi:hypothetical protein
MRALILSLTCLILLTGCEGQDPTGPITNVSNTGPGTVTVCNAEHDVACTAPPPVVVVPPVVVPSP